MVIESLDQGYIWTKPVELLPGDKGGRGPVRNKPIVLTKGHLVGPSFARDQRCLGRLCGYIG